MKSEIAKNILKFTFGFDAIIAIGFGVFSWIFPRETFGTIIAIPEMHSSVFLSLFSSLSLFYIVIGWICVIGIKSVYSTAIWIAFLMLLRHFFEGIIKIGDIGKNWLIGSPYPDLGIHSVFVVMYIWGIFFTYKNKD